MVSFFNSALAFLNLRQNAKETVYYVASICFIKLIPFPTKTIFLLL